MFQLALKYATLSITKYSMCHTMSLPYSQEVNPMTKNDAMIFELESAFCFFESGSNSTQSTLNCKII